MVLFLAIASLGIYYSIILLIRDRGRGKQGTMMAIYSLCISILLLHTLILIHLQDSEYGILQISGTLPLFLLGPFSNWMMIERSHSRSKFRLIYHFLPAVMIIGVILTDHVHEPIVFALGIAHFGIYLFMQVLCLIRKGFAPGSISWNQWYTAAQIFLYLGVGIFCLVMPAKHLYFLASAGLAVLILLIWIRLMYIAYLSYIISRS